MAYSSFGHYVKIEPGDTVKLPVTGLGRRSRSANGWVGYCGYSQDSDVNMLWYLRPIFGVTYLGSNLSPNGWNVVDTSPLWPCDAAVGGTGLPTILESYFKENVNENGYIEVTFPSSFFGSDPFLWIFVLDYSDMYPPNGDQPPPAGYYPNPPLSNYCYIVNRQYPPGAGQLDSGRRSVVTSFFAYRSDPGFDLGVPYVTPLSSSSSAGPSSSSSAPSGGPSPSNSSGFSGSSNFIISSSSSPPPSSSSSSPTCYTPPEPSLASGGPTETKFYVQAPPSLPPDTTLTLQVKMEGETAFKVHTSAVVASQVVTVDALESDHWYAIRWIVDE